MNAPALPRPSRPAPAPSVAPVYAALFDDYGDAVVVAGSLLAQRVRLVLDGAEVLLSPATARELADALDAAAAVAEGV